MFNFYPLIMFVCLMVFNATFNNISVISWRSALLVEEPDDPVKTTNLSQVTDKLYHITLYTLSWSKFELTTSMMTGTDCIGSSKSNYHAMTATTARIYALRFLLSLVNCDHLIIFPIGFYFLGNIDMPSDIII
jgi:hypothetical protein